MLCSTLFWQLLWWCQCQAVLDYLFLWTTSETWRGVMCCMSNHHSLTKLCSGLCPGVPSPWLPHCDGKTQEATVYYLLRRFLRSFCMGNWPLGREWPYLWFKDVWKQAMDIKRCVDVANNRSRWRCNLYWRAEARREETEACCWRKTCSKERKWHSNTTGGHLHIAIETVTPVWVCTAITVALSSQGPIIIYLS